MLLLEEFTIKLVCDQVRNLIHEQLNNLAANQFVFSVEPINKFINETRAYFVDDIDDMSFFNVLKGYATETARKEIDMAENQIRLFDINDVLSNTTKAIAEVE